MRFSRRGGGSPFRLARRLARASSLAPLTAAALGVWLLRRSGLIGNPR